MLSGAVAFAAVAVTSAEALGGELSDLERAFLEPPQEARPWVFWYWMRGAASREGITADLEAMAEAGLGGAYLMPIFGVDEVPLYEPAAPQLSERFWELVGHAFEEAERLELQIAMHASDGFAVAGGPWIAPEESMQKVVWTETFVAGGSGQELELALEQPEAFEGYYEDIAVLAYPRRDGEAVRSSTLAPKVTSSIEGDAAERLADPGNDEPLRSEEPCWVQYAFEKPFICRSLVVRPHGNNYEANRLRVWASDDGESFREVARLESPRHGWQDGDAAFTHAIPETKARYFRFEYDPSGSEPGAEDLDRAKWRTVFKVRSIELFGASRIHQYEGKSGQVWRIDRETTEAEAPAAQCVQLEDIVDLTDKVDAGGRLRWTPPEGEWTVVRIGHTSTGHTNATGGAAKGLECDKFSEAAARKQFRNWFGEAVKVAGPERAGKVLAGFHVDSWECGSQNWTRRFESDFAARRGYELRPYLLLYAGVPVESARRSEQVLRDLRETFAELVVERFFGTMKEEAEAAGCWFSAESVAPTMVSDGMAHFQTVDIPMGEFWLQSPTHDKPNDILDAVSGAHVYGKRIVQAEAFTQLRMAWDEHPGMLKTLGDQNFARGINRFSLHVFTHNPFMDRQLGVTLNGVGLYFQRDQTWWSMGSAWVDYLTRCQAVLQMGVPVVDVAVFMGEEMPRRALLPDRLTSALPGIFGPERIASEVERLEFAGQPLRELPVGVKHSANMADPESWIDPLRGYAFDSINPDALLRLARVEAGRIVLPGGADYAALVVPGPRRMAPEGSVLSLEMERRLAELRRAGAVILDTPYHAADFSELGFEPDFKMTDETGSRIEGVAWTHRRLEEAEVYFIANPEDDASFRGTLSLRSASGEPEIWNPQTGAIYRADGWRRVGGRIQIPLSLAAAESCFIVVRPVDVAGRASAPQWQIPVKQDGPWTLSIPEVGEFQLEELKSWTELGDAAARVYAGAASYQAEFEWEEGPLAIDLGEVAEMAEVLVNGKSCGIVWTAPFRVVVPAEILNPNGENQLRIEVVNTWRNRLIGEYAKPESERSMWTTAPLNLEGAKPIEAGLLGPVRFFREPR